MLLSPLDLMAATSMNAVHWTAAYAIISTPAIRPKVLVVVKRHSPSAYRGRNKAQNAVNIANVHAIVARYCAAVNPRSGWKMGARWARQEVGIAWESPPGLLGRIS